MGALQWMSRGAVVGQIVVVRGKEKGESIGVGKVCGTTIEER